MSESSSKRGRKKSPHKRKGTSPTIRFLVLNRDGFRCQYCGTTAQSAELVVDHIVPVAAGGPTVPENLVTACFTCNAGKSDKRILEEGRSFQEIEAAKDTLAKIQELANLTYKIYRLREWMKQVIVNAWGFNFRRDTMSRDAYFLMRSFVTQHGPELVFRWMEIAAVRVWEKDDESICRYISGIRRNHLDAVEAMKSGTFKDPELQWEPDEE